MILKEAKIYTHCLKQDFHNNSENIQEETTEMSEAGYGLWHAVA